MEYDPSDDRATSYNRNTQKYNQSTITTMKVIITTMTIIMMKVRIATIIVGRQGQWWYYNMQTLQQLGQSQYTDNDMDCD